jgi:hypothetical protein
MNENQKKALLWIDELRASVVSGKLEPLGREVRAHTVRDTKGRRWPSGEQTYIFRGYCSSCAVPMEVAEIPATKEPVASLTSDDQLPQMSALERHSLEAHECSSSHIPKDLACGNFEWCANGRCVYCDHEWRCHPGPGNAGPLGRGSK